MPIFEYICTECERIFEKLHKSGNDPDDVKCPYCGNEKVQRILSSFSSFFAGGENSCGSGGTTGFG